MEVSRVEEGISLRVQDQLLFPSADAGLTDDGSDLIGTLLDTIQRYDGEVWVEGHTDSQTIDTPEYSSNWALSSARAIAIVEALEASGWQQSACVPLDWRLLNRWQITTPPKDEGVTAESKW